MGKPEPIILTAQDGVRIAGDHLNADQPRSAALLLHMMPATKDSWSAFASRLSGLGIASLAIDLRGHGASEGGPDGFRAFDDAAHQAKRLDVDAALVWLRETYRGMPLLAVGASIGANLAIRAAADHPDVKAVLALSPGLTYHGVATEDALRRFGKDQKALLAASRDDAYAVESVERLKGADTPARVETLILEAAGHGTRMLEHDPAFAAQAADWLKEAV